MRLEKKRKNAKKENEAPDAANTQPSEAQPFVNLQSACPLYNLPQEIRDAIFELALTSHEDNSRPHDPNPPTISVTMTVPKSALASSTITGPIRHYAHLSPHIGRDEAYASSYQLEHTIL